MHITMAIIDVVKCEMKDGLLCEKFPSDAIHLGSQLIVYPSQTAFFIKDGSKTTHLVNLIHEGMMTDKGSNEEKKGTYRFTLCHNSYGDKLTPPQTQGYLLTGGYVSFPLSSFISENEAIHFPC